MAIDASIPLQVRPAEIDNPFNALGRVQQLRNAEMQNALMQRQGEIADMNLTQARRTQQREEARSRAFRGAVTPEGTIDRQRLFSSLADENEGALIPELQTSFATQDKHQLDLDKTRLEGAMKRLETMSQLMSGVKDQSSYDQALATAGQVLGPEAVAQMPSFYNPRLIEEGRMRVLPIKEQLAQRWKEIEHQQKLTEFDWRKQHDTATLEETIRGRNMTDSRARQQLALQQEQLASGKVPSGYRALPDGSLTPIPGGPADKIGERQTNQLVGVNNLLDAISTYQDSLKNFNLAGYLRPSERAMMGTYYNNLMLQAKEAYNLGVLNGPDYMIMTDMLTDPRSGKGLILSRADMKRQTDALAGIMRRVGENVDQRRPTLNPSIPTALQTPFNHPPDIQKLLEKHSGSERPR